LRGVQNGETLAAARLIARVVWFVVEQCCRAGVLQHSPSAGHTQANEAELDSVKGMGPALTAKVLKARAQGPFKDWQDLMQRVSGIRQNKSKQFSEQGLTVDGQAFNAKH
jgi:hypothetical protein